MADTAKQFQYEIEAYQKDCINNITNVFENLRQYQSFVDVLTNHRQSNHYNFPVQDTFNSKDNILHRPLENKINNPELFENDLNSHFELDIIEQDPDMESIEIFDKLPQLIIKTPLDKDTPDFCYTIKRATGDKIFLVVKAKGYETETLKYS